MDTNTNKDSHAFNGYTAKEEKLIAAAKESAVAFFQTFGKGRKPKSYGGGWKRLNS